MKVESHRVSVTYAIRDFDWSLAIKLGLKDETGLVGSSFSESYESR
jgi:hypothetical protein